MTPSKWQWLIFLVYLRRIGRIGGATDGMERESCSRLASGG